MKMNRENNINRPFWEGCIRICGALIAYNEEKQEKRGKLSYFVESIGNHMNENPSFYYDGYLLIRDYFEKQKVQRYYYH